MSKSAWLTAACALSETKKQALGKRLPISTGDRFAMLEVELQRKLKLTRTLRTSDATQDRTSLIECAAGRSTRECPHRTIKGV
jgi:hypothetical protein